MVPLGHTGYDDRPYGHSIRWNSSTTWLYETRAILRAQEEYDKAADAFEAGNEAHAAFFLGAMAHYLGDLAQYGHTYRAEEHHGDYESWAKSRTDQPSDGVFESFLSSDGLVARRAHEAGSRISRIAFAGQAAIMSAEDMDESYSDKDQDYIDSVGGALNLAVNEIADVLTRFLGELDN
jgi:hypothetical protein